MDEPQIAVARLYERLLHAWNDRDATAFAALFLDEGCAVGFDGTQMNGRRQIEEALTPIFADHPTAAYVAKIQDIVQIAADVVMVRAIAGMIPPGSKELKRSVTAVQSLVVVNRFSRYAIALFQNTPATFDGRPKAVDALLQALRTVQMTGKTLGNDLDQQ